MAGQMLGIIGIGRNPEAVRPLAARDAKLARSAAEVASTVETVFLSLPTPPPQEAAQ